MISDNAMENKQIKIIECNGKKMAIFTVFDHRNRNPKVTEAHVRFHQQKGIAINYVQIDYRTINHGGIMNAILDELCQEIDYFVFLDNDALILSDDVLNVIYDKLKDGRTVFGGAQNSNHIHKNPTHPFVQPSTFCISSSLYLSLGKPRLGDGIHARSDTCEEVTWLCQERGYNVCLVYPSSYNKLTDEECQSSGNPKTWKLTETLRYGLGTTYGDLFFHAGMQTLPRSAEVFIAKCKSSLGKKEGLDAVIVSVNCADFLSLALPENVEYFDNIYVSTVATDVDTINLCKKYNVNCVICEDPHDRNGHKFDKGYCIQEALKQIPDRNRWLLLLDSDIILPKDFNKKLNLEKLDKSTLYGASRSFAWDYNEYLSYRFDGKQIDEFENIPGGWGCGYFMLFNLNSDKILNIPLSSVYPLGNLETDMVLLERFHPQRVDVGKLDFNVLHLGPHGSKYDGRINGRERFEEIKGKSFQQMPNIKKQLEEK